MSCAALPCRPGVHGDPDPAWSGAWGPGDTHAVHLADCSPIRPFGRAELQSCTTAGGSGSRAVVTVQSAYHALRAAPIHNSPKDTLPVTRCFLMVMHELFGSVYRRG